MNNQNPSRESVRRKMNKGINEILVPNLTFESVPVDEIWQAVRQAGALVVQEDGTEWGGILVGNDSDANFEVVHSSFKKSFYLHLAWYKREGSGRYEIVCYVS